MPSGLAAQPRGRTAPGTPRADVGWVLCAGGAVYSQPLRQPQFIISLVNPGEPGSSAHTWPPTAQNNFASN